MSDPELTTIVWRHPEWIMQQPNGLNSNNVLDYFSESPFWEKHCNNATLKMQTQYNDLKDLMFELKKMRGIEFTVVHERPPFLWIIRKQKRTNEYDATPIATYYVYKAEVYQAPDLYSILANRVMISLRSLHIAFNACHDQIEFHPATGYTWKKAALTESQDSNNKDENSIKIIEQESKEAIDFRESARQSLECANQKILMRQTAAVRALDSMAKQGGHVQLESDDGIGSSRASSSKSRQFI
ncbi:13374_t:CDS:2 [Ambispora leptoticha]|uniref:Mediator of RNA polymerase II transcription subunit 6 n=1 Tax=Ambispora leptoticha TaxID=144679 RepID=A0A9N8YSF1_9GLOM|nr:13374_t:CDS:2 [Ambispora leptoticha]